MPCSLPPACYLLCIGGFFLGVSGQGMKSSSDNEDLVLRLRVNGFALIFWLNKLQLYHCSLYIPSWHRHLYNFTFFRGPAIYFYVAFTQNTDFLGMLVRSVTLC